MKRKELQNLFPPVPGHFLDRIDRTMEEIEAMNTNSIKRIRRVSRPVLIAAIAFALTAATALAAVLGHHALKDALNASGLEDVAEQVTDIQAPCGRAKNCIYPAPLLCRRMGIPTSIA